MRKEEGKGLPVAEQLITSKSTFMLYIVVTFWFWKPSLNRCDGLPLCQLHKNKLTASTSVDFSTARTSEGAAKAQHPKSCDSIMEFIVHDSKFPYLIKHSL